MIDGAAHDAPKVVPKVRFRIPFGRAGLRALRVIFSTSAIERNKPVLDPKWQCSVVRSALAALHIARMPVAS